VIGAICGDIIFAGAIKGNASPQIEGQCKKVFL